MLFCASILFMSCSGISKFAASVRTTTAGVNQPPIQLSANTQEDMIDSNALQVHFLLAFLHLLCQYPIYYEKFVNKRKS